MTSLFIFRLDLRLKDNIALIECFKKSDKIYLAFIFDPVQIDTSKNKYFSHNCVQFMIESLKELYKKSDKKLLFFYGSTKDVIKDTINNLNIDNVCVNRDYTPFSIERDTKIEKLCKTLKCNFYSYDDLMLTPICKIMKPDKTPYSTFTPYLTQALKYKINKPSETNIKTKVQLNKKELKYLIPLQKLDDFYEFNKNINVNGGRSKALYILKSIENQRNYDSKRSLCDYKSTHLSAYIKFGCVSIREVYHTCANKLGKNSGLVKQLYWRDFYYNILYHFPETYTKKRGLKSVYSKFPWSHDKTKFNKWCNGETGFPIVDASMKNLNETGYMPNRSRLIVANFLTKILRVDWTWGERYFAQKLVDYSVSNNLGNWQWVASIGADYQNRIYNPMSQSLKSDPECKYIKKWLPVLDNVPNKDVHNWYSKHEKYSIDYLSPIVDYGTEYKKSKELFKTYA